VFRIFILFIYLALTNTNYDQKAIGVTYADAHSQFIFNNTLFSLGMFIYTYEHRT
jgi:spore cortex formation protein SpoVR/YcgB (stage V sporulation)